MNRKIFFIGLMVLAICTQSCKKSVDYVKSEKVQQENIFQFYHAAYRTETNEMELLATFTVDNKVGKTIQLVEPSYITFNGESLKWNEDGTYTSTVKGFTQELVFQYINNDSKPFLNRLEINKIEVNRKKINLNKTVRNTVGFQGEPFKDSESIVCLLSQADDSFEIDADADGKQIVIYPDYLNEVPAGTYTGYFVRKNSCSDINAMDRGGLWETEYYSNQFQITIE